MDAKTYDFIKQQILKLTGINLDFYKSEQMQRRLGTFLIRSGHKDWASLFKEASSDPAASRRLKDFLTINVSSFFRDTDKYSHLQRVVLPQLLQERPRLRIWSAGCSRGQEPYTIAMVLTELTGNADQHYLLATDLDRSALDWAQAGGPYTSDDVAGMPAAWRERYFDQRDGKYWLNRKLRHQIRFKQQNLLEDPFENNFDLIICRNVVIYFTAPVKDELYQRFRDALRPGGILFVGGTEIVPKASSLGLETVGISFYRRNGVDKGATRYERSISQPLHRSSL